MNTIIKTTVLLIIIFFSITIFLELPKLLLKAAMAITAITVEKRKS